MDGLEDLLEDMDVNPKSQKKADDWEDVDL